MYLTRISKEEASAAGIEVGGKNGETEVKLGRPNWDQILKK
eukprot:CAMPEP_0196578692 /NCGR_PEP_ID=MMETSP1081-20130531/7549_1 /TAXON_ID=36882 /ORGANISM="Pyramimonas amylifera, Strain CCMP720" /LENGTH=40 /DNA_ID= /DNA_START= /DNA_END= /DNA_ORIENTATION=